MAEKTDRRVRKTKAQLRLGLARLMKQKSIKEITVKEPVSYTHLAARIKRHRKRQR